MATVAMIKTKRRCHWERTSRRDRSMRRQERLIHVSFLKGLSGPEQESKTQQDEILDTCQAKSVEPQQGGSTTTTPQRGES